MLVVIGKRWFEKTYGNTYHSVKIYEDKELIANSDFSYGYNDQYRQTAFELVLKAKPGMYSEKKAPNGYYIDYWKFQQENFFQVFDVKRKKDLK